MLSRTTGPLRTILPAVAVGLAALLAGCGAGQVTQTDSMEPAVNGNRGDVGEIALRDARIAHPESGGYTEGEQAALMLSIINSGGTDDELVAVSSPAAREVELTGDTTLPGRNALRVVVPEEPVGETSAPSSEPSTTGTSSPGSESSDTSVTNPSPPAETGDESAEPPPGSEAPPTLTDPSDSEVTETPSSVPEEVGTLSVVLLDLVQDLPAGKNVPVTFVFANAGEITIQLPISPPATARHDPPATEDESH
jgi:copper(I)-binding protein